jgi:hypothetical protein
MSIACVHCAVCGPPLFKRGEVANTHAQSMITCLSECVNLAIWEYENSRKALESLNPSETDVKLFQPLSLSDLKGLSSILKGEHELGEGSRKLPWFWVLQGEEAGLGASSILPLVEEVNEGKSSSCGIPIPLYPTTGS